MKFVTVGELLAALAAFPPDAPVFLAAENQGGPFRPMYAICAGNRGSVAPGTIPAERWADESMEMVAVVWPE